MRRNMFGNIVINDEKDDLGAILEDDLNDTYALISVEENKYFFELLDNVDGEARGQSEPIFSSLEGIRSYLLKWFRAEDIQTTF